MILIYSYSVYMKCKKRIWHFYLEWTVRMLRDYIDKNEKYYFLLKTHRRLTRNRYFCPLTFTCDFILSESIIFGWFWLHRIASVRVFSCVVRVNHIWLILTTYNHKWKWCAWADSTEYDWFWPVRINQICSLIRPQYLHKNKRT